MTLLKLMIYLLMFLGTAIHISFARGQDESNEDPLKDLNLNWYSPEDGKLKSPPLKERPAAGSVHRNSDKLYVEPKSSSWSQWDFSNWFNGNGTGGAALGGFGQLGSICAWIGFGLFGFMLLSFLIWLVLKLDWRRQKDSSSSSDDEEEEELTEERIEALPAEVKSGPRDLLSEAKRFRDAGDFRMAIIYLFSHLLVQLDKNQRIKLARGKTNRQYLTELGRDSGLFQMVEPTVVAFEDVYFGNISLTEGEFSYCWNQFEQFQSTIQTQTRR